MQATATTLDSGTENVPVNSRNKVVVASLIGTAIEFFDFYIYATAAVIVFPHIFFPQGDPTAATLQSLATFAIAFVARPIGSALFGHFGDRIGRKVTLDVPPEFLPHISPLGWAHILLTGEYLWPKEPKA